MAANLGRNRPPSGSAYPDPLLVPKTPLESRQGYHPKSEDRLIWKSPPSRQLSRNKRVEYESDVRERFYDDYLGARTTGDARNEVLTTSELAKMKFDPNYYRVNAYQGLSYDPMRQVPAGLDFKVALQQERAREKQRHTQQYRQRRMSDSAIGTHTNPHFYQDQYSTTAEPQQQYTGPSGPTVLPPLQLQRPRSALQENMGEVVAPDMVPGVESWLLNASKKDQDVAASFFRTLSSHGKRPDPASKAALHHTRVRSAVMTPSRKQRQEDATKAAFQQLSRETMEKQTKPSRKTEPSKKYRERSNSSDKVTKGSMFASNRQPSSHFTVHPDWASESTGQSIKK